MNEEEVIPTKELGSPLVASPDGRILGTNRIESVRFFTEFSGKTVKQILLLLKRRK